MSQLTLKEQASIPTATAAGEGAFWVENTAPSTPVFTDDAGTDRTLVITHGSYVTTTSGTSHTISGLPAGIKRLKVLFYQVSLSGSAHYAIQIGDSGGIEATGYYSTSGVYDTSAQAGTGINTGFLIYIGNGGLATNAELTLSRFDGSGTYGNTWVGAVNHGTNSTFAGTGAGYKQLSDELTQIKIYTTNGTDTFDSGAINIQYEF